MASGYVKMHRELMEHWVFDDDAVFYLWTNLLMRANWKDGKFWPGGDSSPLIVKRGQLVTGRTSLHALLYPTRNSQGQVIKREHNPPHPSTIWRWIKAMEKDGMIALDVRSKYTIITLCNYETYQGSDADDCTTSAQVVRRSCAGDAQVVRTIEEGKKGRREEINTPLPPLLDNPEFATAWADWRQHRREIGKPLKPTSEAKQLRKLESLGLPRAVAAIEHSIAGGWQGIFEDKATAAKATDKPCRPLEPHEFVTWNPVDGGGA